MSLRAQVGARVGDLQLDARVDAESREVVVLLGPNGAGKTSLLRALAGLLPLSGGRIVLEESVLEDVGRNVRVPAQRRRIGFVFQDSLLFPHLTVLENVAFGVRARGHGRAQARRIASGWLDRLGIAHRSGVRARVLSGGEAQRVALARALATQPRMLLLDEPFASLDVGARAELRRDLRRHLGSFEGVQLMVTHDPVEALVMADRIIVLEEGKVLQEGSPEQLRTRPRSAYVAQLVGLNLYRARATAEGLRLPSGATLIASGEHRGEVFATVHPRAVSLYRSRPDGSPRNVWRGAIEAIDREGDRVRLQIGGEIPTVAEITTRALHDLDVQSGDLVWVSLKATEIDVYPGTASTPAEIATP